MTLHGVTLCCSLTESDEKAETNKSGVRMGPLSCDSRQSEWANKYIQNKKKIHRRSKAMQTAEKARPNS